MKKIVLLVLFLIIYFILTRYNCFIVLGYHSFTKGIESNNMELNIKSFDEQMKFLKRHHYRTINLEKVNCYYDGKCKLNNKDVLITFDDGYYSNYELAMPILKKYNFNAVIFYLGINENNTNKVFLNKDNINKIKNKYKNIELASHSYDLHHMNDENNYSLIETDIKKMKELKFIDNRYFAYPFGAHNKHYENELKKNGYKLAFTFGPKREHRKATIKDNRYRIPRLNVSSNMPMYKFIIRMILPI